MSELLDEKISIVEQKLGKKPYEALGISEEHYLKLKESSRYTMLCNCLSYNGVATGNNLKVFGESKTYVAKFKCFLKFASNDDRNSILALIDESLSRDRERKRIQDEIKLKEGELKELERKLKSIY